MADKRVLVIGGSGNFGKRVCRLLAKVDGLIPICGGRRRDRLDAAMVDLSGDGVRDSAVLDIDGDLTGDLSRIAPDIVIHTTGPFQTQDYRVARACIRVGAHYLDLSDARGFTAGIDRLDAAAKAADVLVVSGASTVPGITSALMAQCRGAIPIPVHLDYGIAAAQQTRQGVATAAAVLTYAGDAFNAIEDGVPVRRIGWMGHRRVRIEGLGRRWIADCDIPDLELFPQAYPSLKTIRFGAGVEVTPIMAGFWGIAALHRIGMLPRPDRLASSLVKTSWIFDPLGSDRSGFFFDLTGTGADGRTVRRRFDLVAGSGDGPFIPCLPAIELVKKLAVGAIHSRGAMACMELVPLSDLLDAMRPFDIQWKWKEEDA